MDLSHFASKALTLDENHVITGDYVIDNLYVDGHIDLGGLITDEVNITDLAQNAVTLDSEQTIEGSTF